MLDFTTYGIFEKIKEMSRQNSSFVQCVSAVCGVNVAIWKNFLGVHGVHAFRLPLELELNSIPTTHKSMSKELGLSKINIDSAPHGGATEFGGHRVV